MSSSVRVWHTIFIFLLLCSCRVHNEKDKQLLFWCATNPRELELCTSFTDAWNQSHPADNFHLQPIPEGQSSEEVILAAVVGKTTPDIYANMWQGNVEMYARAGVLIPLDTISGFLPFIRERCDTAVIREITSADGHIYQVPWKVNPFMSIYNKTLFTKNGILDLPVTYSAYRHAASIFKANSLQNGWTQKWFGYTEVKEIWYQRLFNFYPLYLAASGGAPLVINNKAAFNNKYAIEVFAFLQSLYRDEYFSRENLSASEDPFVAQLIATKWTGPWEIAYLKTIPDRNFEFGYFEPQVPDDHQGPVYTYADPKNIVVFNTCTRPHAAWDLIRTMIDKKGDLNLLTKTGQFPRRKNLQSDPFYSAYFKMNPMMVPFAKELPYVKGVDNCEVIVEVLDIISQEYESCVVYGKKNTGKGNTGRGKRSECIIGWRHQDVTGQKINIFEMKEKGLYIGVVGAGEFARFATNAFLKVPGVKVIAVTDLNKNAAVQMGDELNARVYELFEELLDDGNVQLVYIATPPFLHYEQSKKALMAGKHVICEKPAALKTSEAEELAVIAASKQLLYTVNLMQRYNPLFKTIKTIIQDNILGNFLHGYFENYASSEKLNSEHWFWDVSKSGGIFIEHGVHFFDLYAGWLGEGKIAGAWQLIRPHQREPIIDRVQATVLYEGGIVNFYHGFDQADIMDRQEFRLLFERGEITMYGWVPVKMKLHGLLKKGQLKKLKEIVVSFSIAYHQGSFDEEEYTDHITMEHENILGKQQLYRQMLTDMIADQHGWIVDRLHVRTIDDKNAVQSTRMAEEATRVSGKIMNKKEIIL